MTATRTKASVRNKVGRALRRGKLVRLPCERCGTTDRVHAHHDDYSKPLDVRWLCRAHHREVHSEINAGGIVRNDPDQASIVASRRFGERCRALRVQRGLSQMDMGRHFGWDLSHYQRIERGVLDPKLSTMAKLAECFGVALSDLTCGV